MDLAVGTIRDKRLRHILRLRRRFRCCSPQLSTGCADHRGCLPSLSYCCRQEPRSQQMGVSRLSPFSGRARFAGCLVFWRHDWPWGPEHLWNKPDSIRDAVCKDLRVTLKPRSVNAVPVLCLVGSVAAPNREVLRAQKVLLHRFTAGFS